VMMLSLILVSDTASALKVKGSLTLDALPSPSRSSLDGAGFRYSRQRLLLKARGDEEGINVLI